MKYTSATAFRQALEQRLKNEAASTGLGLARLRKRVAFELFLRRLLAVAPDRWVLKGALALDFRLAAITRATKDIDIGRSDDEAAARGSRRPADTANTPIETLTATRSTLYATATTSSVNLLSGLLRSPARPATIQMSAPAPRRRRNQLTPLTASSHAHTARPSVNTARPTSCAVPPDSDASPHPANATSSGGFGNCAIGKPRGQPTCPRRQSSAVLTASCSQTGGRQRI